ncbi:hypothetical protein [Zunongwangia sp. HGR-M22]|uniref:hypothetical protein n=1 Tax=Zunongwangia sp. HGR-M22 TaxID=3015168 RepID=UPI0022DE8A47|nr:hypothetical protein [Zunongwangia sp. HGR-M22]WBL25649.1 hypothetical protein PBT91_17360 [Zunongwangia sp. HGR-M22]
MRKVNQNQTDRLYRFTSEHLVEYYDVQTELVDHLASAIEEKWSQNPSFEFEEMLQQEFKKFGVFGFLEVVEARQKAMTKTYWNLVLNEALTFLKLPKVLLIIGVVSFIFWSLTKLEFGKIIIASIVLLEMILLFYQLIKLNGEKKKRAKRNEKIYLLEEMILNVGQIAAISFFPGYLLIHFDKIVPVDIGSIIMAILITLSFVIHYIAVVVLPSRKEEILIEIYPELKLNY